MEASGQRPRGGGGDGHAAAATARGMQWRCRWQRRWQRPAAATRRPAAMTTVAMAAPAVDDDVNKNYN